MSPAAADILTTDMPFGRSLATQHTDGATLETWRNGRKLTIDMPSRGPLEYTRVWGSCIETEMDDGTITDPHQIADLWRWLETDA